MARKAIQEIKAETYYNIINHIQTVSYPPVQWNYSLFTRFSGRVTDPLLTDQYPQKHQFSYDLIVFDLWTYWSPNQQ